MWFRYALGYRLGLLNHQVEQITKNPDTWSGLDEVKYGSYYKIIGTRTQTSRPCGVEGDDGDASARTGFSC